MYRLNTYDLKKKNAMLLLSFLFFLERSPSIKKEKQVPGEYLFFKHEVFIC